MRKRKGARSSNQGLRVYQCTFCMADFANYGDWRRHEEVIHLVLDKWVCAPEGQYKGNTRECVYCDEVHEEQSNIPNRCNASYCHGKGPAERVFARKDHLKQHLKRMHGITTWRPSFECWSKKAKGPQKSRCGFCTTTFDDWHTRMQHVALEFKNGQKMASWEGDWGLDATWMMGKLGNAMLPISRPDHISNTIQNDIGENPQLQTPRNTPQTAGGGGVVSGGSASAIPDKGKGRLRRKPGLNSLGSGFAAKLPEEYWQDIHQPQGDVSQQMVEQFYLQQQQNQQQQFQGHVLTRTSSLYLPLFILTINKQQNHGPRPLHLSSLRSHRTRPITLTLIIRTLPSTSNHVRRRTKVRRRGLMEVG